MRSLFVLYDPTRVNSYSFLLYPFIQSHRENLFFSVRLDLPAAIGDGDGLLLVGWLRRTPASRIQPIIEAAKRLNVKVAYFDDSDSAEIGHPDVFHLFDLWFKKQIYSDLGMYSGLENNFEKKYKRLWDKSVLDPKIQSATISSARQNEAKISAIDVSKLRVAWNILVGSYPIQKHVQRVTGVMGILFGHYGGILAHSLLNDEEPLVEKSLYFGREPFCQARFSGKSYGVVGEQRDRFLNMAKCSGKFKTGILPPSQYIKELKSVAAVLSPFGWGEVCYRDSEAIRNGACLIKPDCSHLLTWPDVYQDGVTYVAIDWRGENLIDKTENLLSDDLLQIRMKKAAFDVLKSAHDNLGARVDYLIKQFDEVELD